MAQVIIPGIAAAVSAGTATAGQLLIFGAVNLGVSAVASYALNALTPKPKIPGVGGFLVNEVNPTAPAEYVYGEVRKGGIVTYDEATDGNAILHRIIVLAAGEHEVGDIYLNDEVVDISDNSYDVTDPSDPSDVYTGAGWVITEKWMEDNRIREPRIRIFVHDGSQTATTDTFANSDTATLANTLLASTANGLDANFVGKGLTYLYVQMNIDAEVFAGGIPRITAKLKRKGVYDPRDDTSKITSNWALCVADYLQASYGLGDTGSVDNTALSAEANLCDEAVALDAGGTQPRYEMNGVFRADETPGQILSRMMPSGSGQLFWGQGKWQIRAGEYAGSIASFGLSDLRSGIQVETRTPRAQNYNAVRGVFNDKSQRYIEGEYPPLTPSTFVTEDGGFENILDYDLPFETNGIRAQRLAKLALYRQREQITVEADFNMRAASVQPGDVIDLTIDRYGWTAKEFEVVGWTLKISESGTLCVRLSLKETSEDAFDWTAEETVFSANNTTLPSLKEVLALNRALRSDENNLFPNGPLHGGVLRDVTLYSDTAEPTNELNLSVVQRDPDSDFVPEVICPFPGMIKIAMGDELDSVAEYEVNSGDAANTDHPNYQREHVYLTVDRLLPINPERDVYVSFWISELAASVDNGWTDDGDMSPFVRVYFYDEDGTQITSGLTYEDHYARLTGPATRDVWQRVTASFVPPSTAAFCSFEMVALGVNLGQAVGFGVVYLAGFEIRNTEDTQFLARNSIHEQASATGTNLVPTADDTFEEVLSVTVAVKDLPATDTDGETVTLRARASGFSKSDGVERNTYELRVNSTTVSDFSSTENTQLGLGCVESVASGTSHTVELFMKTTDRTVTELDDGLLDVEVLLR